MSLLNTRTTKDFRVIIMACYDTLVLTNAFSVSTLIVSLRYILVTRRMISWPSAEECSSSLLDTFVHLEYRLMGGILRWQKSKWPIKITAHTFPLMWRIAEKQLFLSNNNGCSHQLQLCCEICPHTHSLKDEQRTVLKAFIEGKDDFLFSWMDTILSWPEPWPSQMYERYVWSKVEQY